MTNYRICTQREPQFDGLFWLLGWKWNWWLEDDRQGDWAQTWHDPYKTMGYGAHRARSKEKAIEAGKGSIAYIRKQEDKQRRIREARAATHECIDVE